MRCGCVPRGDRDPLLGDLARDRADAGVRVLHVIDRVVARLAGGDGEVELQRAVVAPGEEREAGGVAANLLQQLLHQHELATALGHAHRLAVAQECHQLDQEHLERVGRVPERLHGRAHAPDVAVVVGTEQVDQAIGGGELHVVVIGDVHPEVGRLATAPPQHAVLVVGGLVADLGRAKPQRAVLLVREPARRQLIEHPGRQAAVTDVALLGRPHVELDAVLGQHAPLPLEHARHCPPAETSAPAPRTGCRRR